MCEGGGQGVYSSIGLAGACVGANGFTWLYEVDFRLPLLGLGVACGVCVLVGGLLVRLGEARGMAVPEAGPTNL